MLQARGQLSTDTSQLKMMNQILAEDSDDENKLGTTEPAPLIVSEVDSDNDSLSLLSFGKQETTDGGDHDQDDNEEDEEDEEDSDEYEKDKHSNNEGSARQINPDFRHQQGSDEEATALFPNWQKLVYTRLGARDQTTMNAIILNFKKTGIVDLSGIDPNFLDSFRSAFIGAQEYLSCNEPTRHSEGYEQFGITSMVRILSGLTPDETPSYGNNMNGNAGNNGHMPTNGANSHHPHHSYNHQANPAMPPYASAVPLADRIAQYGIDGPGSVESDNSADEADSPNNLPYVVEDFDRPYRGKHSTPASCLKRHSTIEAEPSDKDGNSSPKRPRVL